MELSESDTLILFSPVTAAELWAGARLPEYAKLEALFDAFVCVPADATVGRKAGEYLRRYRKSHAVELGMLLLPQVLYRVVDTCGHGIESITDARAYVLR